MPRARSFRVPALLITLLALAATVRAPAASAGPTVGFIESWPTLGNTSSWGGGVSIANPGTGGVGGASDGFLLISNAAEGNLGVFSSGAEYVGDWVAAGVQSVRLSLNDVNADDPLEIHFSIGTMFNLWQYNEGFVPPHQAWAQFVVDLTDASKFTQIRGAGTFLGALQAADRVHLRHDLAPFGPTPDTVQGDLGIDNLELSSENVPVLRSTWGRIKLLYR
jgi:hypothetical protein